MNLGRWKVCLLGVSWELHTLGTLDWLNWKYSAPEADLLGHQSPVSTERIIYPLFAKVAKMPLMGWLKQQKRIFSQFWRLEVWDQGFGTSGFPWGLEAQLVKNKNSPQSRRHNFDPWEGKIPWKRAWQPTPVLLPGESHGQRSLVGWSPWGGSVRHDWSDLARTPEASSLICSGHLPAEPARGLSSVHSHFWCPHSSSKDTSHSG